jgi:HSP20 family protein
MNLIRRPTPALAKPPAEAEWNPFHAMRELMGWDPFREMTPLFAPETGAFMPDVDVKEMPNAYVFKADVPGMKEKDLEVTFADNRLTLRGMREEERREEKATYYTVERSYGSFERAFTLPAGADTEHAGAELKDGVLTITVPKKAEVQPKKIPVGAPVDKPAAKA